MIPLINEIFEENYERDVEIIHLSDNHQTEKSEVDEDGEIITDSYFRIQNNSYHLECQSNPDGTIVFRMVEYDFHIALDNALRKGEENIAFSKSAVLYLRHNSNTKDSLKLKITFPIDQTVDYIIKIVKAKEISKEEIIRKKLYFLVPYYIMRVEDEPSSKVLDDYIDLLQAMLRDREAGNLSEYDVVSIRRLLCKLADSVYGSNAVITKGVEKIMGGKVIYDEFDKAYDEAIARGTAKGIEQGREEGLNALVVSLKEFIPDFESLYAAVIKNEAYKDVTREVVMKYYSEE